MVSSLLVITKNGVEAFLSSGPDNKQEDSSTCSKLYNLVKYAPAFLFTSLFRISGMVAATSIDTHGYWRVWLMNLFGPFILPFLTLVCAKGCCMLQNLTLTEILRGSIGELGTLLQILDNPCSFLRGGSKKRPF